VTTGRAARNPVVRNPEDDYRKKAAREAAGVARRLTRAGHPAPLGDPASGLLIVVEQPIGPRLLEALQRSLEAVKLPDAYVTWASTGLLLEGILSLQPSVLISIGPGAAREVDSLDYPLVRNPFSDVLHGTWFSWTSSVSGLSLPALAPALEDDEAKRIFWRAFLTLQNLPTSQ
jgi:hypothetical protein